MTTSNLIIAGALPTPDHEAMNVALKNKVQALGALTTLLRQALTTVASSLPEGDDYRAALNQIIETTPEQALERLRSNTPPRR